MDIRELCKARGLQLQCLRGVPFEEIVEGLPLRAAQDCNMAMRLLSEGQDATLAHAKIVIDVLREKSAAAVVRKHRDWFASTCGGIPDGPFEVLCELDALTVESCIRFLTKVGRLNSTERN